MSPKMAATDVDRPTTAQEILLDLPGSSTFLALTSAALSVAKAPIKAPRIVPTRVIKAIRVFSDIFFCYLLCELDQRDLYVKDSFI
jgi:hypothetical protein